MSIITKPLSIVKNSAAEFTLDKAALAAVASVAANAYYSVSSNWSKVILQYKSSVGNQKELLEFNASLATPTSSFLVSSRARDIFQVNKIVIVDFDGGTFVVPRSQLTVAEFDIDLSVLPVSALYNPDQKSSLITLSNNNLTASQLSSYSGVSCQAYITPSFLFSSGKKYIEYLVDNNNDQGLLIGAAVANEAPSSFEEQTPYYFGSMKLAFIDQGFCSVNSSTVGDSFVFTTTDILMLAIDLDNKKIWLGKNGSWFGFENPVTNTGGYSISSLSGTNVYLGVGFQIGRTGQVSIRTVQSYKPASFTAI